MTRRYVLITAARNEGDVLRATLEAVVAQEERPARWVIASDGSTDATESLVKEFSAREPFIELVTVPPGARRDFASKVRALRLAMERLAGDAYDFIGNFDADITVEPDYFRRLLDRFADAKLGIGGGWILEPEGPAFAPRPSNATSSVPGALQMFRRACFEQMGGLHPLELGGEDWLAETMARMRGWKVTSFPDLPARHHKPPGRHGTSLLKTRFREGRMDYTLGSHPLFEVAKCLRRLPEPPVVAGSLIRAAGFCAGPFVDRARRVPEDARKALRAEQVGRMRSAMIGLVRGAWTGLNEWLLNVQTVKAPADAAAAGPGRPWWRGPATDRTAHDDNYGYASPDYWYIRKIAGVLDPTPEDVVYDIGAGMGRIVCVMARRRVKKCVGVELMESLCDAARKNAAQLRGRVAPIEIVSADATRADLSDGTIYFFFNPFGADTMRDVLANIERSLAARPRRVKMVYYNAAHEDVLAACPWLRQYHAFRTASGLRVSFWQAAGP